MRTISALNSVSTQSFDRFMTHRRSSPQSTRHVIAETGKILYSTEHKEAVVVCTFFEDAKYHSARRIHPKQQGRLKECFETSSGLLASINYVTSDLMGLDEDHDYVLYGSRLVDQDELSRKKGKLAIQKGQARQVAPWNQHVTDEEGRRRFHGAFTGGFSAGYYNTVGSKEGWTPSTFVSSRSNRAGRKEQTVHDFLDEDEKEELKVNELVPSAEYDAIGSTAAALGRQNANNEIRLWSSVVPGLVPDAVIAESQSIGVKLLMKMGWRQKLSIGEDRLAFPSGVNNRHGLGVETLKSNYGDESLSNTVQQDEETGRNTISKRSKSGISGKKEDCLPSFTAATDSSLTVQPLRLPTLVVPEEFTPRHVLPAPLDIERYRSRQEPPDVPSPDAKIAKAVNGVAAFVARSGQQFEGILKQKHAKNPQFSFLFEGGAGHEFYLRRLWEEQRNLSLQGKKQILPQSGSTKVELVGANRGNILGETPLQRTETVVASSINSEDKSSSFARSEALSELTAQMNTRFITTGGSATQPNFVEEIKQVGGLKYANDTDNLPKITKRVETPWRPTSLLCKRFNVPDPYIGKETMLPKPSQMDSFTILANLSGIGKEPSLHVTPTQPSTSASNALTNEDTREAIISEDAIDLYKAIFSDDDDEDEDQSGKPVLGPKDSDAASNSKAAGVFLESLGKELGLRV